MWAINYHGYVGRLARGVHNKFSGLEFLLY